MSVRSTYIVTLTAQDKPGIVAAVSSSIAALSLNIVSSQQFQDPDSKRFFMRIGLSALAGPVALKSLKRAIEGVLNDPSATVSVYDGREPLRILVMVSKFDHCLMDLLYRMRTHTLPVTVTAIVSNHGDAERLAFEHDIPFHHLPISKDTKAEQEDRWLTLMDETQSELVVLARYMQILSSEACARLDGRAINIHHSFLPSFKGARPYHQAHAKGVKLIGATAHYVTPDLDEGPIIEQNVARVHHAMSPEDLKTLGRDVERITLAEAVKLHAERRVLLNGSKTVVLRPGG